MNEPSCSLSASLTSFRRFSFKTLSFLIYFSAALLSSEYKDFIALSITLDNSRLWWYWSSLPFFLKVGSSCFILFTHSCTALSVMSCDMQGVLQKIISNLKCSYSKNYEINSNSFNGCKNISLFSYGSIYWLNILGLYLIII